jgi:hypothetical protein
MDISYSAKDSDNFFYAWIHEEYENDGFVKLLICGDSK